MDTSIDPDSPRERQEAGSDTVDTSLGDTDSSDASVDVSDSGDADSSDASNDASDSGDADSSDASNDAFDSGDARDESCDSVANPGIILLGPEVHITDGGIAINISLVWSGDSYGLSWMNNTTGVPSIVYATMPASGEPFLSFSTISNSLYPAMHPSLSWNGLDSAIAWTQMTDTGTFDLGIALIDEFGQRSSEISYISSEEGDLGLPFLVSNNDGYGLVWNLSYPREIYFANVTSSGLPDDLSNLVAASGKNPSLSWNGTEYGMAYIDDEEVFFVRLNSSGETEGDALFVSRRGTTTQVPSLVWTGSVFGLSWDEYGSIFFATISADGTVQNPATAVVETPSIARAPAIASNGTEFLIVYEDSCFSGHCLRAVYITNDGNIGDNIVQITSEEAAATGPALVWADGEFGVVWEDARHENSEIYFNRLSICP